MNLPSTGKTKKALAQSSLDIAFKRTRSSKLFHNFFQTLRMQHVISGNTFTYYMYKLVCEPNTVNLCIIFMLINKLQNILYDFKLDLQGLIFNHFLRTEILFIWC